MERKSPSLKVDAGGGDGLGVVINLQGAGAADADFAHLAGHQGRVRADAALGGENAFGGDHAAQILRRGFVADKQDLFALLGGGGAAVGVQIELAGSGAGTGGQTLGDDLGGLLGFRFEDRGQELVELLGRVAADGGLPVNELLLDHVHRELERGHGGALAVAGLEHEHLAVLDRELEVLHVLEVLLQRACGCCPVP